METIIELKHLSKAFGANVVLKDINATVEKGDVTCIIGASGSGKSTMLRCINLLETPTSGDILYRGKSIINEKISVNEYRTHVGMCFQSFNLFNNMTVLKNCMIGQMKVLKRSKEEAYANAIKYLEKVGMAPYINARPDQEVRSRELLLQEHLQWILKFFCLMNLPVRWIRKWLVKFFLS